MFELLKKLFGFSSPLATTVAEIQVAPATTPVVPALVPKPVLPVFFLPETAEEYIRRVPDDRASHKLRCDEDEIDSKRIQLEAKATELEGRDASPAQSELNRREAIRVRNEAALLRYPTSVDSWEIEREVRAKEVRKILATGEVLHRECGEDTERTSCGYGNILTPTDRSMVSYRGRVFLVAVRKDGKVWATESVAQMSDEELKAIG